MKIGLIILGLVLSLTPLFAGELDAYRLYNTLGEEISYEQMIDALDQAESLTELNIPGFNFNGLRGVPKRYSIHVNGPWCITFEWEDGASLKVNLEQYH